MLPDLDSSAAAIWASGIRAAVIFVLPKETDLPHDATTVQIIRQSERNRIKARFLELADLLADGTQADTEVPVMQQKCSPRLDIDELLIDQRRPGQIMQTIPVKLPAERLEQLKQMAVGLDCYAGTLARALVMHGLCQLDMDEETTPDPDPEPDDDDDDPSLSAAERNPSLR